MMHLKTIVNHCTRKGYIPLRNGRKKKLQKQSILICGSRKWLKEWAKSMVIMVKKSNLRLCKNSSGHQSASVTVVCSPFMFDIFLERIMQATIQCHHTSIPYRWQTHLLLGIR
ncbi:hypothetical protein DPMN_074705 [Dreissena polymorpha]|uniref:Uncharacterized protein n=1 Tax=Dreissena polymorpha TaxID=45954 RepID=A0A9D3YJ44_DREPO|nr:hypothetical protein DPMN_074705 [Dreissena polymorpha]